MGGVKISYIVIMHVLTNPVLSLQPGILGVEGQNGKRLCQGGKPGTGKLNTDVCLCGSAHTSRCMVNGLGATATY